MVKKLRRPVPPQNWRAVPSATEAERQIASLLQRAQARFHAAAYGEARDLARRVLELKPHDVNAYHVLAAIAFTEQNFAEAEILFTSAIGLNRRAPHLRYHLGNVQRAQGNHESAAATFRQALKLDPGFAPAYLSLGAALRALGRPQEARECLQRYLQRQPYDADGRHELALAFRDLGKFDLALEHARAALSISPDHMPARKNLATTLLLVENFREGWPAWLQTFTKAKLRLPDPAIGGAAFQKKRVVIYANEGVGDEIMFASCVPDLVKHAPDITLYCDGRLAPLFQRSFPTVRTLAMAKEGAQRTVGLVGPDEFHVLASYLPAYFRFDTASFPQRTSYLRADPVQVSEWRRRFDALGPGLKIGLSWRGGVDPANRAQRSIPLFAWAPVLQIEGAHFVSLQYGDVGAEIEQVRAQTRVPIHTWSDADPLLELDFFAAEIAALDLVVSIDNSTVHMAGALGIPVWALLPRIPDWRWKMAGTTPPWYASIHLIRQREAGQWESVLQQVRTLLAEYTTRGLVDPEVAG